METSQSQPMFSERINRIRDHVLSSVYEADIERARYYTKAYRETEGQLPCIRAAKGLEETLRNMSIQIREDDRLVGAKTIRTIAGPMGIERNASGGDGSEYGMSLRSRRAPKTDDIGKDAYEWRKGMKNLSEAEKKEFKEDILPYWQDKSATLLMKQRWEEKGLPVGKNPFTEVAGAASMQGHVTIGLKKILDLGWKGIYEQAENRLKGLKETEDRYEEKKDFLESVLVSTMAIQAHCERYAKLAEDMAKEATGDRKAELLAIAERCRRTPWEPPKTFMDAVQATWMSQSLLVLSYGEDSIFAPGRVDQYLYPYYKKDKEEGRITKEEASEILDEYFIKLATFNGFGPNNLTIGGLDRNGEDATNEISYLMLDSCYRIKGLRNGLAVRLSNKMPRDFLVKACEVHRRTAGIAFYNDDIITGDLMNDGYALEDARDYGVVGCVELTSTGNNNGYTSGSSCRFQNVLEMALHEGCRYMTGWKQVGVKTPPASEMKNFEDVKQAFEDQLAYAIEMMVKLSDAKDEVFAESFPTPLLSSTIEGCIESGLDATRGGAKYNHACVSAQGLATVADSLAAIKWAVFEEKILTMEELVQHLRNNWKDAEDLRQQMLRRAPKYGRNDPKADEMAAWVADCLATESRKHKRPMDGGTYRGLLISAGGQVAAGMMLGATPDGRRAGEPVSNGMSPTNGMDIDGMTAALHSAAKVSKGASLSGGTSFNMNLNPMTLKTDEGVDKMASLLEGYIELGGRQVQFNPMSKEILKDAQKNPRDYLDLMVKVSGYSYRFIDLTKDLQNDILNRTEFDL